MSLDAVRCDFRPCPNNRRTHPRRSVARCGVAHGNADARAGFRSTRHRRCARRHQSRHRSATRAGSNSPSNTGNPRRCCGRGSSASSPAQRIRCRAKPRRGQGVADARQGAVDRVQAAAGARDDKRFRWAARAARWRSSAAASRHVPRARQQLSRVRAGAAAHLARCARRSTCTRASASMHQHPVTLDKPDATLERLYMQALLLALANPYGFLPSQLAHSAATTCRSTRTGRSSRRSRRCTGWRRRSPSCRSATTFRRSRRTRAARRRQQAVPAHVRPRVPDPGADSRARSGRPAAARSRHEAEARAAVHRAAEAAAAPMGDSAGAPVQPAAVARACRHVRRIARRVAIQPRHARQASQGRRCAAADDAVPGRSITRPAAMRCARSTRRPPRCASATSSRCASKAGRRSRSRWCAGSATRSTTRCSSSAANCCPKARGGGGGAGERAGWRRCCRWSCCRKKTMRTTRAAAAARRTRRRVRARAGGEPAPGQRDRLRRAHEARRAGTGIRALRIRRGRLTHGHARLAVAVPTLALLALEVLWELVLAPLAPARLVARAEGAAARAAGAGRAARRSSRAAMAALLLPFYVAEALCARAIGRGAASAWRGRGRDSTCGRVVERRRRRADRSGWLRRAESRSPSASGTRSSRRRLSSSVTTRAPSARSRSITCVHQHLGRRRAGGDADAPLALDPLGLELGRRCRPCTPARRGSRRPRAAGSSSSCSGCRRRSPRRTADAMNLTASWRFCVA